MLSSLLRLAATTTLLRGPAEPSPEAIAVSATPLVEAVPIGGPTTSSWREQALTRIAELEDLTEVFRRGGAEPAQILADGVHRHLDAARAAAAGDPDGRARRTRIARFVGGSPVERAASNIDAAEADLLRLAPGGYVAGQLPSLLFHVQAHLQPGDPRRRRVETIVAAGPASVDGVERDVLVAAVRAASSAARREVVQVRSFRNVLYVTAALLTAAVVALALIAHSRPDVLPLCFNPPGEVVCPLGDRSVAMDSDGVTRADVDHIMRDLATGWDVLIVGFLGLVAGAVAAARMLRSIRGTTTPYSLPVALALLKLPTGALTAVLGLLLMRGNFVPGLSALDSPGQILAWAILFGYAQQVFTHVVDQRAHEVLDNVRRSDSAAAAGRSDLSSAQ
jgi:hypothetical protein